MMNSPSYHLPLQGLLSYAVLTIKRDSDCRKEASRNPGNAELLAGFALWLESLTPD
jgi:hypothetical protein